MNFWIGDKVQRIWNGPPTVWTVMGIIRVPPPRWDTEGTEQISYQLLNCRGDYQAIVPDEELKYAI